MAITTEPPETRGRKPGKSGAADNVEIHEATIADDWVERTSAPYGGDFLDCLSELCWNARDAGASAILIDFSGGADVSVVDDGMGMNLTRRSAFLNWGKSNWDTKSSVRGKNGNGRLGALNHCERMSAETKASGESLHVTSFTAQELREMWKIGRGTWERKSLPPKHPIRTTGTVITLHNLGKGAKVNSRHPRSAKRVIEGLAKLLPVDQAQIIRVKDEKGVTHELKQRKLRGKIIEGDHHGVPLVGDVSYRLGVVEKHEADVDTVELFALSKVCTLAEFFSTIAKIGNASLHVYLKACRAVLEHPLVSGIIDVPLINKFVGDARNRVGEELFDQHDVLLAILKFLRETVVPKVESAIGLKSDQIERSDDETLIRSLLEMVGAKTAGRGKPAPDGGPDAQTTLSLDTGHFYVLCGGAHAITVTDPREGGTITWTVRGEGTLDKTVGTRVVLTAGKTPGRANVTIKETLKDAPTRETAVRADVVLEFPFQFDTAVRSATPLQRITLKLRYPKRVRGKIAWSAPAGTTLEQKGDRDGIGIEEVVFSATATGEYAVEASVTGEEDLLKVCTVKVAERDATEVTSASRRELEYERHIYELRVRNFPEGSDGERHAVWSAGGGLGRTVISANLANSQFARKADTVRMPLVLLHIAGIIAEVELGKAGEMITPSALRSKTNEVYAALAARGARRSNAA